MTRILPESGEQDSALEGCVRGWARLMMRRSIAKKISYPFHGKLRGETRP
jgi:hypothetical protein